MNKYIFLGIFPLALVNFITLSGGGFQHVPGEGVRLKTMSELAEEVLLKIFPMYAKYINKYFTTVCEKKDS